MGCCQTNLASPNHPVNINHRNFIDRIKQDASLPDPNQNIKNKTNNQKITLTEDEQYQYSVHGLVEGEENQLSSVSIFDEEKRLRTAQNTIDGRRIMGHAEIHPQTPGEMQRPITIQQLQQPVQQKTQHKTNTFEPSCQEFPISRIDLLHPGNNLSHQDNHFLNKQICSSSLLQHQDNNQESLDLKETCKAIYNQTDRELVELNEEIATMIILWDHKGTDGKKLRLETMKHEEQVEENIEHKDGWVDKDLQEIWKEQQDYIAAKPQEKSLDCQAKVKKLKEQYILQANHNKPQSNKPNQKCLLNNHKLKQKLTQTHQTSQKSSQKQNLHSQKKQQLKLHLSKMKSRKPHQQNSPLDNNYNNKPTASPQYQSQSQNQSQDDYSHCLLSNPTRILNESFVEEFNIEKEMFYFCDQGSYTKWIQNDRKAFQVNKKLIQDYLIGEYDDNNDKSHMLSDTTKTNNQTIHLNPLTQTFCTLLSVVRDYHQLTGINLIAYRTFSSTSIFMQPQERQQNYTGFRIFFNGTKRIYPFTECFDCTQIAQELLKMIQKLSEKQKNPAELLYNLTGWIPEYIVVGEINSFQGIFQRLNNNFIEGNTIITFTGKRGESWGLKSINLERKQITLYGRINKSQPYKQINQFQEKHSWQQFTAMIQTINVNWNPLIYENVWKTQNIFFDQKLTPTQRQKKDMISQLDPYYVSNKSHQYLLKIPPSEDDIQLRVFLQTHYDNNTVINSDTQPLVIELYDYIGTRIQTFPIAIRKIDKKTAVYSDVLIFQGSKQRTEYILLVRPQSLTQPLPQLKYTISAFSFFQVGLSELAQQRVIQQKQITTFLQQSHCGYGINSPYFLDNFYMQLKLPANQRVKIFVQMPSDECCFEVNLIANPEGQENLTRLNLETILNDIIASDEFSSGKGYLEVETKHEEYFLMLTNHTKCKGEFKIIVQVLEKQPKALTKQKLHQIQAINSSKDEFTPRLISYKQRFFYQQPLHKKQFKWSPVNTGPRKRLKSNTHSDYQPFATFKQFFKNPFTDFRLQKGKKYQFSVISQTFKEQFDQIQHDQDKNDAEPPTLSLGILKMVKGEQYGDCQKEAQNTMAFKIVLDDAFYVPFGFGFWTKAMQFQEGDYRFVFPRMQKQGGKGVFYIYEVKG